MINPQARGHQIVKFFLLVWVVAVKQLRKCASDPVIQVLQRDATAENLGEGCVPEKAPRGPARFQDTQVLFSKRPASTRRKTASL